MSKGADAFRTISEVAEWLGVQTHVLRFWESKFTQIKPVKRAGGRRYYRPADMLLLGGIRKLLHEDGMTIKGVQKILREQGMAAVSDLSPPLDDSPIDGVPAPEVQIVDETATEPEAPMLEDAPVPEATVTALTPAPAAEETTLSAAPASVEASADTAPPTPTDADPVAELQSSEAAPEEPDLPPFDASRPVVDDRPEEDATSDDAPEAGPELPAFLTRPMPVPDVPQAVTLDDTADAAPTPPDPVDDEPALPSFLTLPSDGTPELADSRPNAAPLEQDSQDTTSAPAPKPIVVDAPDPALDAPTRPGPLSYLGALHHLPPHQRAALRTIGQQLASWHRDATAPR